LQCSSSEYFFFYPSSNFFLESSLLSSLARTSRVINDHHPRLLIVTHSLHSHRRNAGHVWDMPAPPRLPLLMLCCCAG